METLETSKRVHLAAGGTDFLRIVALISDDDEIQVKAFDDDCEVALADFEHAALEEFFAGKMKEECFADREADATDDRLFHKRIENRRMAQ